MIQPKNKEINKKIARIETTDELLTGRGGMALVSRYLSNVGLLQEELPLLNALKGHQKGVTVHSMFLQMVLNFIDGTSQHLNRFDEIKGDAAYSEVIGITELAGSSAIKRFLKKCSLTRSRGFRRLFERLFIWRLKLENAPYIKLDMDTVVFDNHDAKKREGVSWTYKERNGFQPLLMKYNGYVIASKFREGKAHSNHGTDATDMITDMVGLIRKHCSKPILITLDGGFFDQKLMAVCEALNIGYIVGGKIFKDIRARLMQIPEDEFGIFSKQQGLTTQWHYTEFMDKRDSWDKERRLVITSAHAEGKQTLLPGAGDVSLNYTNLGIDAEVTLAFEDAGCGYLAETENIIMLAHNRGEDELTHRHIKDFAGEQLPCLEFGMNEAYFMIMLISFNLHQAFKRDCCEAHIGRDCYPTTFRRKVIDFAGRIVKHARTTVMKVAAAVKESLSLDSIWEAASIPI